MDGWRLGDGEGGNGEMGGRVGKEGMDGMEWDGMEYQAIFFLQEWNFLSLFDSKFPNNFHLKVGRIG